MAKSLSYTLSNSGDGITPEGQIVIIDDKGIILASVTSPETSASSIDQNSIVTWPNGDNVKIMVYWHVDGKTASDDVMIFFVLVCVLLIKKSIGVVGWSNAMMMNAFVNRRGCDDGDVYYLVWWSINNDEQ